MIITETLHYKRLVRMCALGMRYEQNLPTIAAETIDALAENVTALGALAGSQAAAAGRALDLVRAKRVAREALKKDLLAIHRIATAVALETPGFADNFQMPRLGDPKLLTAARAFAELATPLVDVFVKHARPAGFIEDLQRDIQLLEQASAQYTDGARAYGDVKAAIAKALDRATVAATRLDALVRNTLHQDLEKIENWDRACEFGRKPVKRVTATEAAPTPTPPIAATVAA